MMRNGGLTIGRCFDAIVDDVTSVDYREGESLAAHLKLDEGVLDVCIPAEATSTANQHQTEEFIPVNICGIEVT